MRPVVLVLVADGVAVLRCQPSAAKVVADVADDASR